MLKRKSMRHNRTANVDYKERDETIYHISECNKLAQKEYKTRHDIVGKVIHWELCKRLKFNHTTKVVFVQTRISPREWDQKEFSWILRY